MVKQQKAGCGKPVGVLLVDDYEPWRRFVRSTLQNVMEVQVVDEVSDGLAAVQRAQELQPGLVLLDIGLPTLNGIEVARRIRDISPSSKILFVSQNRSQEIAKEALRSRGSGYVVKSNAASELLPAIDAVLHGKQFLSAGLKGGNSVDTADCRSEKVTAASPLESECHEFRLCTDEADLMNGFSRSVKFALNNGNASLVITTESHCAFLLQKLRADGIDVETAVERKLLILLDIADSLSTLTANTANQEKRSASLPYVIVEAVRRAEERRLHVAVG